MQLYIYIKKNSQLPYYTIYGTYIDYLNSCQHITSTRGTFASLEPVVNTKESDVNTRPDLIRKTTLLISVKYNQVIWVDFGNLSKDKRTKVKVHYS